MASDPPQTAPWEAAAPEDQLFVLITGANSGIGLAAGERLIDEFLATRPLTAHLILLPTTRSAAKSRDTIHALRAHANRAAQTSTALQSRAGPQDYKWEEHARRIHVLSVQIDLCDIRAAYALARRMCTGTIGNPSGTQGPDGELVRVTLPRLDSVIFNAAYGGWSGCNYAQAIWSMLFKGFIQSVTRPGFKIVMPTRMLNEFAGYKYPPKPLLGEVFVACVFGHYLFARQLLPLLSRPQGSSISPGRIVWTSSVDAVAGKFDPADMQALRPNSAPYESAKRLTDVLALSQSLPSVKRLSGAYLSGEEDQVPPRMYLTHPGVVASTLFPLPWFLFWAYELALMFARWIGSPWHPVNAYGGAKSVAWVALSEQAALDALDAERAKWGSAADAQGRAYVKRTEVDSWGWNGRMEDNTEAGSDADANGSDCEDVHVLKRSVGRQLDAKPTKQEDLAEFEELGRTCWEQMEELREEWEEMLELD